MKPFIPAKFHGYVDYLFCFALGTSPWWAGYAHISRAAVMVPIFFSWLTLIMSIFSNRSSGFVREMPIQMHMVMDLFAGFFIMVSPWLYDFAGPGNYGEGTWAVHFFFGAYLFLQAIFTIQSPLTTPTHEAQREAGIWSVDSTEGRLSDH